MPTSTEFFRTPALFKMSQAPARSAGDWSMSFAIDFGTMDQAFISQIPLLNSQGAVFTFNPYDYCSGVANLGDIQSVAFSCTFSTPLSVGLPGSLCIYSPSSGMTQFIAPSYSAVGPGNTEFPGALGMAVNGCLPIVASDHSPILFAKQQDTDGPYTRGELWATVANYKMTSYLYCGGTAFTAS